MFVFLGIKNEYFALELRHPCARNFQGSRIGGHKILNYAHISYIFHHTFFLREPPPVDVSTRFLSYVAHDVSKSSSRRPICLRSTLKQLSTSGQSEPTVHVN